jgi:transcriptional regulator with XRE-family HTH domain
MMHEANHEPLRGHALRNANLCERALRRAQDANPLAHALVRIRAETLRMTRLALSRQSGVPRGTLRDLELGVHRPTRRIFLRVLSFFRERGVPACQLDHLENLYLGEHDPWSQLLRRLELQAGSARDLAIRVGLSPSAWWQCTQGNIPIPFSLLERLCAAVGEPLAEAEPLWLLQERKRLRQRGYPEALAELWALAHRQGYAEKHLLELGIRTAVMRRLRYLEVPAWSEVAEVARRLCRDDSEWQRLRDLWQRDEEHHPLQEADAFGPQLLQLREQQEISRRELSDLFAVGGKKPAQVIAAIEEKGCYSRRAYPAGLVAILTSDREQQQHLRQLWEQRRNTFHRRRHPWIRIELRLCCEWYGLGAGEIEPALGYTWGQYQQLERSLLRLTEAGYQRTLAALEQAGQHRVGSLLAQRANQQRQRLTWQAPPSAPALIEMLAQREGGLIPLARLLKNASVRRVWPDRLRTIARGGEVPAWPVLEEIARVGAVRDVRAVHADWRTRYRQQLEQGHHSILGVELRLLIAEQTTSLREFSDRLAFHASLLTRLLQRVDANQPVRWPAIEAILQGAGVTQEDQPWQTIHAWWFSLNCTGGRGRE